MIGCLLALICLALPCAGAALAGMPGLIVGLILALLIICRTNSTGQE